MDKILHKDNKPVTKEEIEFAEQAFQVKLPEMYVQLLKISNGGALNFCWLNVQGVAGLESEEGYIYVDRLLGIKLPNSNDGSLETNIMDTNYLKREWGIEQDHIILIAGDGHWWIALDYRTSGEPAITYFDTENEREIHLYNHFDEMINSMHDAIETENDEIKASNFSIENLKEKLYGNSFKMIHEGVMVWEQLVLDGNKLEHFYNDRIVEIFKMKDLEFFNEEDKAQLRLRIGFTISKLLQSEKNIIDKKFLEDFLAYLNKSENLDGLKFMIENALVVYNERWAKE